MEELGVQFSCCRDEPHARGFNSQLKLVRTKTLMEGDDCCDFRYYLKEK
ncbi:MAG: L-2-amino-thiazoline-4-carboxylic acid hydrolase [bacterium]|nr:L-2-amino-thiazoline-4-carboxylic acid hydrolase [bacterium]